jgi:hypothetical protein
MKTTEVNETLLQSSIVEEKAKSAKSTQFIDAMIDSKTKQNSTEFIFDNIKNMSYEQIDKVFTNKENNQKAKNLKLATSFTNDTNLAKALFNTVLGKPFNIGYSYLFDIYEDKHNYLNYFSNRKDRSFSDILQDVISNRLQNGENSTKTIPQEYIDEILGKVNSFNFLSVLSSSYKNGYDRDRGGEYSFLYNDYYLEYQELIYKYEYSKQNELMLLKQYS